jgi:hypothetical protein
MLITSLIINAVLLFALWRLNGSRTVKDAIKVVIQGGGGPGEESGP